jgi:MoxR-like ATPase
LPLGLPDLRSRLSAALVYHLIELNDEDKARALMAAAARLGMGLPETVAAHLLRRLPRDWRALHAALEQLNEASLSAGRALTLPFVRATLALTRASRAKAFLDGRGYVLPQDVKDVALDVLRHRLTLSYEAEAEERSTDDLVRALLDHVPVP